MTLIALLAWGAVEQNPVFGASLGLSSIGAVGLAVASYVLLQAGRLVHEAGHAFAGIATGRQLLAIRVTPLLMAAEWPPNELWRAPSGSRRLTALAGSGAQAAFGLMLLLVAALYAGHWPTVLQEVVFLCGALHVAALANLLPVADADGHFLFGQAWTPRPAWLGPVVGVLLALLVPLAITAMQFEEGFVRAYLVSMTGFSTLIPLVLAVALMPVAARRWLFPRA